MDWLRRNWPDLLIGVALVAVIAMIVATLLSGGSLASLVRRDTPPDLAVTDTTGTDAAGTTAAGTAGTNTAGTNTAGTDTADATDSAGTAGGADYDVFVPDVPGQPADGAAGDQDADGGALPGGTRGGGQGAGSQATGALPEAAAAGGYRVAAGATPSRDAAATLAQSYRDEGYEATVEQQGDLYLLWIGPYASDAGAERVAARLRADGLVPDALVYTYGGGGNGGEEDETAAGTTGGAATEGTLAQADAEPNEAAGAAEVAQAGSQSAGNGNVAGSGVAGGAATAGAGQRYLQVGAFASDESAQPRRVQLENLGLNVSRSEDASGLVRLYVGPFGGAQLTQTQRRLSAAGIVDAFPVTR